MTSTATASPLTATQEDYLLTIHRILEEQPVARVRDIAGLLGVSLSTVSAALKNLSDQELIDYAPHQFITLSEKGRRLGRRLAKKHEIIASFLTRILGLDENIAEENAHRLEHAVDEEVMGRLVSFIEFINECPRAGDAWLEGFHYYSETGHTMKSCDASQPPCTLLRNTPIAAGPDRND
ncbi:MAG: metal-dependent transcriptional regulator [Deltaproteobacteria bacterium]|nr:metal-dependent transcriptional regulator [Candidatus Anaeroferrophillacea bacterium]